MSKVYTVIVSFLLVLSSISCSLNPITPPNDEDSSIDPLFTFERLFDDTRYKELVIEVTQAEWNNLDQKMRQNWSNLGTVKTKEYAKANFTYKDSEGETTISNVGIRIRGNLSAKFIQDQEGNLEMVHWKINFRETFNDTIRVNKGRRAFGLKELDMKYNRNQDPSYIAESYGLEMMEHFGVYAQEVSHAMVIINIGGTEHKLGIYTIFEPIDDEFFEKRFDDVLEDGILYKSLWQGYGPASLQPITNSLQIGEETLTYHPSYDLKSKHTNHDELKKFINNINSLQGEAFNTYIKDHFDVELFLRYLAVQAMIGNPDDYRAMGNNYYLYQHSSTKMWYMIPYDLDHSFAQGYAWNPTENYTIGLDVHTWFNAMVINSGDFYWNPILATKILGIKEHVDRFDDILKEILDDDFFTFNAYEARLNLVKELYEDKLTGALLNVSFGIGRAEWYINAKRNDIINQLK